MLLILLYMIFLWTLSFMSTTGHEHTVEWKIPKSRNAFNKWASDHRFIVGDTLRFKYEWDSIMEVKEEEYEKCETSRPIFFSNDGDTVSDLDRPGPFFFISGVFGHCRRGLKMAIKVLDRPHHQHIIINNSTTPVASHATSLSSKFHFSFYHFSFILPLLFFFAY